MNTLKRSILTAITMGGAFVATSHAQTFDAVADTYVRYHNNNTFEYMNYGNSNVLSATNDGGSINNKDKDTFSFIRFDIGAGNLNFSDATFSITSSAATTGYEFQLFGIPDLGPDELFIEGSGGDTFPGPINEDGDPNPKYDPDEDGLTFLRSAYRGDGDPSYNGSLDYSQLTLLDTFTVDTGEVATINSSALLDFINVDTNGAITLVLYRTTVNQNGTLSYFHSRESGFGPTLTLNTIPEPSDFALMAGVVGLFFVIRRRKAA